ncbi:hypothetical protein [Mesorhizobium xinjiangense]|uniref:hypothetical protein n=1 Tax=Mesorhizobium xinjiangense TaxID=2678685 RepID=UPI0012ED2C37|nr:hypothetical protein [Mesorhizobium xinjiangense]
MLDMMATLLAALPRALNLGVDAMSFDATAFHRVGNAVGVNPLALLVVVLAGLSQAVGQGVVLLLNRVPKPRFALSLVLMGAIYVAAATVTAVTTMIAADFAFASNVAFWPTIGVVALAHAPRLLGVFTLAPYFGDGLNRLLDIWVFVLVPYGLHYGLALPVAAALLSALIGWLSTRILWLLFGQPLTRLITFLRHFIAGGALPIDRQNLVEFLKAKAKEAVEMRGPGK